MHGPNGGSQVTDRAELLSIVKSVVKFGDFTLSSGKKSDFYIDCRLVTLHARGLLLTSRAMAERCLARSGFHLVSYDFGASDLWIQAAIVAEKVH